VEVPVDEHYDEHYDDDHLGDVRPEGRLPIGPGW